MGSWCTAAGSNGSCSWWTSAPWLGVHSTRRRWIHGSGHLSETGSTAESVGQAKDAPQIDGAPVPPVRSVRQPTHLGQEVPTPQDRIASLLASSPFVPPLFPGGSSGRRDRSQPAQFIVKAAKSDDQQRDQGHRRQRVPGIGVLRGDQQ